MIIHIVADTFNSSLLLPTAFEQLPLANIKKLIQLIRRHEYENRDGVEELKTFFPLWVSDCKEEYETASKCYQDEYRVPDRTCYSRNQVKKIEAENKKNMTAVVTAKRKYEKSLKVKELFDNEHF